LRDTTIISIVDDDEFIRLATRSLVLSLGFKAQVFASAEEFLQSPEAQDSSCIISDMNMPGMNGAELQRRLAACGCRTPIIFMTAFPDRATEERALKAGAVSYLIKPFEGQALIASLEKALRRKI
jgi:FixJ family two-component response regulator